MITSPRRGRDNTAFSCEAPSLAPASSAASRCSTPLIHWSRISVQSVLALSYLIVFGSLVAFTAYTWLLRVTLPAHAATYAYVNPVVAVVLGWALGGEPLTARTLLAAAVIVGAVVIITASQPPPSQAAAAGPAEGPLPGGSTG